MNAPTHFVYLIQRPQDKEPWPHITTNPTHSLQDQHRVSPVMSLRLHQTEPDRYVQPRKWENKPAPPRPVDDIWSVPNDWTPFAAPITPVDVPPCS